MDSKITLAGKEYEVSKLKCKHLRRITSLLKTEAPAGFESIDRWMPFLVDSVKLNGQPVTQADLDELDLDQFNELWAKVIAVSGGQINKGEAVPAANSDGTRSTEESAPLSAGTIVQ